MTKTPVNIEIFSSEHSRKLRFSSAIRVPMTRKFVEELEKQGFNFDIEKR